MNIAQMCEFATSMPVREWPEEIFRSRIFGEVYRIPIGCLLVDILTTEPSGNIDEGRPLCASKRRAREDVKSGAIYVSGIPVCDEAYRIAEVDAVHDKWIVIGKGKKGKRHVEVYELFKP